MNDVQNKNPIAIIMTDIAIAICILHLISLKKIQN